MRLISIALSSCALFPLIYAQVATSSPEGFFHLPIPNIILDSTMEKNVTAAELTSGQIPLDEINPSRYLLQLRTLGKSRCVLKMVCYFGEDETPENSSYGEQVARLFNNVWDRLHPKFMDRFFGYEDSLAVTRTHNHSGCILKYNSCPMNIINMIYLSTNLQKLENAAPQVYSILKDRAVTAAELDDNVEDPVDAREVFDLIRDINDPEHPLTLEQLKVVSEELVTVDPASRVIKVMFTPTIPHCSMATLIGLCIRVKLMRSLPREFKIDLMITPGKHDQEKAINKQLQDKERVAAALENPNLLSVVNKCIAEPDY